MSIKFVLNSLISPFHQANWKKNGRLLINYNQLVITTISIIPFEIRWEIDQYSCGIHKLLFNGRSIVAKFRNIHLIRACDHDQPVHVGDRVLPLAWYRVALIFTSINNKLNMNCSKSIGIWPKYEEKICKNASLNRLLQPQILGSEAVL